MREAHLSVTAPGCRWFIVACVCLGCDGAIVRADQRVKIAVDRSLPIPFAPQKTYRQAPELLILQQLEVAGARPKLVGLSPTTDPVFDVRDTFQISAAGLPFKIERYSGHVTPFRPVVGRRKQVKPLRLPAGGPGPGLQFPPIPNLTTWTYLTPLLGELAAFNFDKLDALIDRADNPHYVELDYAHHINGSEPPRYGTAMWGHESIGLAAAWNAVPGHEVVVAVLDTGVDLSHGLLRPWDNTNARGFSVLRGAVASDGNGHGTHCAGIIGASAHADTGVCGINPEARIMPVKAFDYAGRLAYAASVKNGIVVAVKNGARIVNMSFGGYALSYQVEEEIAKAKRVLFVASAGNGGSWNEPCEPVWPASYYHDNIISVLSIDGPRKVSGRSRLSRCSSTNPETVDLGAPGRAILSTDLFNGFACRSGTSAAAAYVSGAASLVWGHEAYQNYSPTQIRCLLLDNVRPMTDLKGKCLSEGTLDLSFLDEPSPPPPPVSVYYGTIERVKEPKEKCTGYLLRVGGELTHEIDIGSLALTQTQYETLLCKVKVWSDTGKEVMIEGSVCDCLGVKGGKRKILTATDIRDPYGLDCELSSSPEEP